MFINTGLRLAFINRNGTGYLQQDFAVKCYNCGLVITKQTLGVAKFARDLVIDPDSPSDSRTYGQGVFMAYVI